MRSFLLVGFILLVGYSYTQTGTLTDSRDGKVYKTIVIGTQTWMAENLNVSTFRNGDPIPEAKTHEEWEKAAKNKQPAWCYLYDDPANGAKYGKLYNWYAVNDSRGIAPVGYHIPSRAELTKLTDFLGGIEVAGKKMKSKSGWNSYTTGGSKTCPNCVNWNAEYRRKVPCHTCQDKRSVPAPKVTRTGNGTNISGFSGLPGSCRSPDGYPYDDGKRSCWWSSTEEANGDNTDTARGYGLDYIDGGFYTLLDWKAKGFSVRCIKD